MRQLLSNIKRQQPSFSTTMADSIRLFTNKLYDLLLAGYTYHAPINDKQELEISELCKDRLKSGYPPRYGTCYSGLSPDCLMNVS